MHNNTIHWIIHWIIHGAVDNALSSGLSTLRWLIIKWLWGFCGFYVVHICPTAPSTHIRCHKADHKLTAKNFQSG